MEKKEEVGKAKRKTGFFSKVFFLKEKF